MTSGGRRGAITDHLTTIGNILLILVYRPPNTDCSLFFNDLERNIPILSAEKRHVFLFGDFNLDTFF